MENLHLDRRTQHAPIDGISITTGTTNGSDTSMHSHDFNELVIILDGNAIQRINDEKFLVSAGDVFVIKDNDVHGFIEANKLHLFNIGYKNEILLQEEDSLKKIPGYFRLFYLQPLYRKQKRFESRLHLNVQELLEIKTLLHSLKEEFEKRTPGCEAIVKAYFLQIVVLFARKYSSCKLNTSRCITPLAKAIHYIEEHYTEKIRLEQLAKDAGLQVNTLLHEFKSMFGTSPIHYVTELRIRKACELLINDKKSITEIAAEVGFSDSNYFTRLFKQRVGLTPTEYRKSY